MVAVSVALNLSLCCWSQASLLGLAVSQSLNPHPHPPPQAAPTRLLGGLWALPRCLLSSEQNREPARGCPFALYAAMDGIKSVV